MMALSTRREMIERDLKSPCVSRQCKLLGLHRSGVYYTAATESEDNLSIMEFLDKQYLETPFYGVERLLALLILKGYHINHKRLRRLMKLVRWQTLYPQKSTTIADGKAAKYPYLLKDLTITRPNQAWAVDITYIPMRHGFMYLFAVIDLYSRYVTGWSLSNTMTAQWCANTLEQAIALHGKPDIINSDQGSQFTSDAWIDCLKSHDIKISMDGRGRAIDNVFIERLWRSVKYEHVYLHVYDDGNQLWKGLDWYFRFYNNERLHQNLGYVTPVQWYYSRAA